MIELVIGNQLTKEYHIDYQLKVTSKQLWYQFFVVNVKSYGYDQKSFFKKANKQCFKY